MIFYTSGYKYQLSETYAVHVGVLAPPGEPIKTDFIDLDCLGLLTIRKGYAWDGPSGPTKSIADALARVPFIGAKLLKMFLKAFMRGSLVHDPLYQLMRMQKLPASARDLADRELRKMCREDGMSRVRAWWVYRGVSLGGESAASPSNVKEIHTAP